MIIIIIIQKIFLSCAIGFNASHDQIFPQMKLGDIGGYTPSTKRENSTFKI